MTASLLILDHMGRAESRIVIQLSWVFNFLHTVVASNLESISLIPTDLDKKHHEITI